MFDPGGQKVNQRSKHRFKFSVHKELLLIPFYRFQWIVMPRAFHTNDNALAKPGPAIIPSINIGNLDFTPRRRVPSRLVNILPVKLL